MADVYGVNYNSEYVASPKARSASSSTGGEKRILSDSKVLASDAAGTDVLVGKLWSGCVISDFRIFSDDLGTGVTLQVAIRDKEGNETAVSTAMDAASAAAVLVPVAADISTLPAAVDENVDVIVKIAGGTATGTIKTDITYSDA